MTDSEVTVCTAHLRFVPCRGGKPGSPCIHSTEQRMIDVVRRYQETFGGK